MKSYEKVCLSPSSLSGLRGLFVAGIPQMDLENKNLLCVLRGVCIENKDGAVEKNMLLATN